MKFIVYLEEQKQKIEILKKVKNVPKWDKLIQVNQTNIEPAQSFTNLGSV